MDYREYPVPGRLSPIVETIWTLAGPAADEVTAHPVVPDGRSELIIHFGDPFDREDGGRIERQPGIILAGQLERALALRPTGRIAVLGVRLCPAGAAALIETPQHELANRTIDPAQVSRPLAAWLSEVRDRATSLDEAARLVSTGLLRLMKIDRVDPRVERAAALMDRPARRVPVARIATHVGLTRRQLERLFLTQVGTSPKRLMRIRRLQAALAMLESSHLSGQGAATAAASGYADQSHFVRDCRAIAGFTPGRHQLRKAQLTGLFLAGDRDGR